MKPVLRKPSQVEGSLGPNSCWLCDLRSREVCLYRFDFKEEADLPGTFSAIEELLVCTSDGSMPVHRQERDYLTCATMSTSNLTRLI